MVAKLARKRGARNQAVDPGQAPPDCRMCPKCRKVVRNGKFNRHMKQEHEGGTL